MKKLFKILTLLLILLLITGCDSISGSDIQQTRRRLPDLTGMSREEISKELTDLGFKFSFGFENKMYKTEDEYDKFVKYGNDLEMGDRVSIDTYLYVLTTALPLPSVNQYAVEMDLDYEGKTFLEDGIEEVTLSRAIDGDTAHFIGQDGSYIKVRFLGIDTPESTYEKEPWGKAASEFTKNILENAETIVIEAEGNIHDTYDRYLAFVWADGVLVNLEVVHNGYSNSKLSASSKYFDAFYDTELEISLTGRRFWGEIDPNYDYQRKDFK